MLSLCKLFGVTLCTLCGVLSKYGTRGRAHGRGPPDPTRQVSACPIPTWKMTVRLFRSPQRLEFHFEALNGRVAQYRRFGSG